MVTGYRLAVGNGPQTLLMPRGCTIQRWVRGEAYVSARFTTLNLNVFGGDELDMIPRTFWVRPAGSRSIPNARNYIGTANMLSATWHVWEDDETANNTNTGEEGSP